MAWCRAGLPSAQRCTFCFPPPAFAVLSGAWGQGPEVLPRHAREPRPSLRWGGGREWEPGVPPSPVPSRPPPAIREPRRPPARKRSAVRAPPGSGARNSAARAWPPRSPPAPWRGGAPETGRKRGGAQRRRARGRARGRGRGLRQAGGGARAWGAGLGAGTEAARAVGGEAWGIEAGPGGARVSGWGVGEGVEASRGSGRRDLGKGPLEAGPGGGL